MLEACLPLGPVTTSKLTFWPSFKVLNPFIWIAEKCANKSSPPSSGVMNPKPFASLNHLTIPVAIHFLCVDVPISPLRHESVRGTPPHVANRPGVVPRGRSTFGPGDLV